MSRTSDDRGSDGPTGLGPRTIAGVVLAALALVFVVQNTARGRVNFLFWDLEAPAWMWMLALFLAGLVAGSLFPWLRGRRKS